MNKTKESETPKQTNTLEAEIYNILYKNSTVDIVRVLHEDEWPITELLALFQKVVDKVENRIELVGGMGIKASMGVALTADEWIEIKSYFKDIVEGKIEL